MLTLVLMKKPQHNGLSKCAGYLDQEYNIIPFYAIDTELFDFQQIRGCLRSNNLNLDAKYYSDFTVPAGPDIGRNYQYKNQKAPLGRNIGFNMSSLRDSETF